MLLPTIETAEKKGVPRCLLSKVGAVEGQLELESFRQLSSSDAYLNELFLITCILASRLFSKIIINCFEALFSWPSQSKRGLCSFFRLDGRKTMPLS